MLGMATLSFYNEIQVCECPICFYDLKEKIKELFFLDKNQINNCLISYIDKDSEIHYIMNEEQYEKIIPFIESIILRLEISDEDKYLTIEPLVDEEYGIYKLDCDKDKSTIDEDNIEYEEYDDFYEEYEGNEVDENENEKIKNLTKIHEGIECNLCGCKNIIGIRYLCGICKNYNLCEECEKLIGKEHNHPLLKIRNPQSAPLSFSCELSNK